MLVACDLLCLPLFCLRRWVPCFSDLPLELFCCYQMLICIHWLKCLRRSIIGPWDVWFKDDFVTEFRISRLYLLFFIVLLVPVNKLGYAILHLIAIKLCFCLIERFVSHQVESLELMIFEQYRESPLNKLKPSVEVKNVKKLVYYLMCLEKHSCAFPTSWLEAHWMQSIVNKSRDEVKKAVIFCCLVSVQSFQEYHLELVQSVVV